MVERLKKEYNMDVEWRPFYLRPDTPPEGMDLPEYIVRARANGSEERLHQLAEAHGMTYIPAERILNTRVAHEATEYARSKNRANEFHKIVFHKVYAEGLDISKWDVLRAAAAEAGLDADDMQKQVEDGKFTGEVAGQVQQAYRIGVSGVPTYVINDKYAVVGAQPYEVFKNALERIVAHKRVGARNISP
ncbi:MAG: DsbA family oxidoreductase [Chloroflexi bacterium CFX1]|nr:DsbA family oxidoreductase [Chloroflexi bacterium CFX1]MCQ3952097.1 DsbA family oxidoreductase [Chloroflexota bacterium]MDL1920561.1 DsbA family oxidoreductase [Chloroflexi bacterium CFX5]NUQ57848.1 DsbA family protein [Anaerolineales bacterium]